MNFFFTKGGGWGVHVRILLQTKINHLSESKQCIRNSQNDHYPAPGMEREVWGAAKLLTEEKITVPAEKMKESNNEEATETASRSRKRACPTKEEAFPSSVQDHVLDLERKLEEAQEETANMAKQLSRVLKDLECPICLESSDVLYVRTPCGHKSGCRGCIGVLINPTDAKRQRVCPICRANSRTLQRVFL